jgi:hypothetical protein
MLAKPPLRKIFDRIKRIFLRELTNIIHSDSDDTSLDGQPEFIWCLIGNIVDEHISGNDQEIKHGTKHFSANTKVYCFPILWGDGYEKIKVIGRHRKSKRYICIVMPSKFITNWRLQKVYSPSVLREMRSQNGWTNGEKDKETIVEMLKGLPAKSIISKN